MTPDDRAPPAERPKDPHGGNGHQGGGQVDVGGSGTGPSLPFSITITIEIKGHATCPPEVKVR
jgi:hypothetical protein